MHVNRGTEHVEPDSMVDAVLSASRVLVAVAARSLADAGEDVTLTQYRSLVVLASRGPKTVAELADLVAVTPPTASRLCDRLVKKGLIRRRAGRHDRRQVHIALTETGRELIDAVTVRRRREIADLLAAIPLETQRSVVTALAQVGRGRRRGARTGLEYRLGPVSAPDDDASSQPRRVGPGTQRPGGALGGFCLLSQEVERPRRRDRGGRRARRHRVLRGARRVHPLLLERVRRLPGAHAGR